MTITSFAPHFDTQILSTEEPEMTVEQRFRSLFLLEKFPYKVFGENSQPNQRTRDFKDSATMANGSNPGAV